MNPKLETTETKPNHLLERCLLQKQPGQLRVYLELFLLILSTSLAPPAFSMAVVAEHITICSFNYSSSYSLTATFLEYVFQFVTDHLSLSRAWSHL